MSLYLIIKINLFGIPTQINMNIDFNLKKSLFYCKFKIFKKSKNRKEM